MLPFADLRNSIARVQCLKPAARATGTTNGTPVSNILVGTGMRRAVSFDLGTWTDGTHTFEIQEAPDVNGVAGSWTAVDPSNLDAAAGVLDATTGHLIVSSVTNDEQVVVVNYLGGLDWLRVVLTGAGITTGMPAAATIETTGLRYDGHLSPGRDTSTFEATI